jgi:excisionase family DNA binding protein
MTAYAAAEKPGLNRQPTLRNTGVSTPVPTETAASGAALLDQLVLQLADLVADRLIERSRTEQATSTVAWLDTKQAGEYLGVHRDTIRKLAAERVIPTHQDGPGCKLYFRREELDEWRGASRQIAGVHSGLRAV